MATPHTDKKPATSKLTAATLILWREQMGFNMNQAADALGCSKRSIINWENSHHDVPRYIGLAMGALAVGMHPYGNDRSDKGEGEE